MFILHHTVVPAPHDRSDGNIRAGSSQDKIVVRAGESAVIVRKTKPITNERASVGSVTKAEQETRPEKTYILLYVPPVGAEQIEDTVQYTVDGQTITVPISVRSSLRRSLTATFTIPRSKPCSCFSSLPCW